MFKATMKSNVMKDMLALTSALVQETKLSAQGNGIVIKAVDPAHVAMLVLNMDSTAFTHYECDGTDLGIPLDKFKDALKTVSTEMSMEHDEQHGRLIVSSGNITRRMNVLDLSSFADVKVPTLEHEVSITVPLSEINRSIVASAEISDTIMLTVGNGKLCLTAGKDEGDTVEMELSVPVDNEGVHTMIPLDYFTKIIKAIHTDDITFGISTDYPLSISFSQNGISGMYLIAPRIEMD